jgi:small subunit ribosomal protein S9
MVDKKSVKSPSEKYFYAVGRRKTAIAQVKIKKGSGNLLINGNKTDIDNYLAAPLQLTDNFGKYSIEAKVLGGGKQGQIEAIRLGIARALVKLNLEYRTTLKKSGLLTRDPREKERKKCGLKRARKAPQWSKR